MTTERSLCLIPTVPFEPEAELSVLAEVAEPLHDYPTLRTVTAEMFYDGRHRAIVWALERFDELRAEDADYLTSAIRYAFPLTAGVLASFFETAKKRQRLYELERERLELLGVAV